MTLSIVTGANRGIGLSLARLLVARGDRVLGACRSSSPELDATGAEVVTGIDVATEGAPEALARALGERKVGLLINNAGVLNWDDRLDALDPDGIRRQLEVNAIGPLRLTAALRNHLVGGAKVAFITSRMGSIEDNSSGGYYGYRMSKAALNMAARSLAVDLRPQGILVAILHPGMVKTDMVRGHGQVEPEDAARNLIARVDALTPETTGTFWHANGEILPW